MSLTLAGVLVTLHVAAAQTLPRPADLDARVAAFEATTGLNLHVMGDPKEPEPIGDPAQQGPVDPELVLKHLDVIEDVMMMYPTTIRGSLITDLYLLGKLQMGGTPFLGSARADKKAFILAIRPRSTPASLRSTLHHELAHLIELNAAFDYQRWVEVSSPYNGRLQDKEELKGFELDVWWEQGFASRYGSKNRHEDFAEYAEWGFTAPAAMEKAAQTYPIVEKKVEMLTAAYDQFAPGMDLPWAKGADTPKPVEPPPVQPPPVQPPPVQPPPATPPPDLSEPVADTGAPQSEPTRKRAAARVDDKGNVVRTAAP